MATAKSVQTRQDHKKGLMNQRPQARRQQQPLPPYAFQTFWLWLQLLRAASQISCGPSIDPHQDASQALSHGLEVIGLGAVV